MTYSRHLWVHDLLSELGVPGSSFNARALVAQIQSEGGPAKWNPLNTTVKVGNATPINDLGGGLHVWSFASRTDGLEATAATFRQHNFEHLLEALRRGSSAMYYWQELITPPPGGDRWGSGTPAGPDGRKLTIAQWLADVDRHWYDYALRPIVGS